ncbi:uncharacterized protein VP01_9335g1, partial [Puccinia sorghi]
FFFPQHTRQIYVFTSPSKVPNDWPRRKLSEKLRHASTPQLANKTPLPLNQIPLPLPPPIPWCLPNPNPLMGPVAPLPMHLLARLASMLDIRLVDEGLHSNLVSDILNGEQVVFFRSSFFDCNSRHHPKVALRNLCQTGAVLAYTQDFNKHTHTVGWANTPLMSLYQHSLKENIQLAM